MHFIHKWKEKEIYKDDSFEFIIQECSKCDKTRMLCSAYGTRYRILYGFALHEANLYIKDFDLKNIKETNDT